MFAIDRTFSFPLLSLDTAGLATVVLVQPLWTDLVATASHLLHDQVMIGIETIGEWVKT